MKLKRVRIFGFKTFADKTDLELDGSIIAVVGPNGCGKSNIVDSILWGLGETSAKHLRASSGREVIFSGSAKRRPLGYAEVTLHFDNEDGALPIDSPEVSISRRFTKAGDSKYQINRKNCRLRDVADLLADSGLGKAGYAIVGQSEIDQALAASPQQRRAWIDEAAGVQRYRARRVESIRRLDAARTHLQRIHDLVLELEDQREPLRAEAEIAKRYRSVRDGLRETELAILVKEVCKAVRDYNELDDKSKSQAKLARLESERADDLEKAAERIGKTVQELEAKLEALRDQRHSDQSALEQAISRRKIAEHKLESLDEWEKRMSEEADSFEERLKQAEEDLAEAEKSSEQESAVLDQLETSLSSADSEAKDLAEQLRQAESTLKDGRVQEEKRQRVLVEQEHRDTRLAEIKEELEGVIDALPDLIEAEKEAEEAHVAASDKLSACRKDAAEAQAELIDLKKVVDEFESTSRALLSERAAMDGRRRGIEATLEAHEGLNQGARSVLDLVDDGRLSGLYLPVAEAIDCEPAHSKAIETALGHSGNDLIVRTDAAAKDAIQLLREGRLGRATFQPLSLVSPKQPPEEMFAAANKPGVIGIAADLVDCDDDHRPVIESLLGRVLIVEDLDASLKIAKTRGWNRLVTLDGETVHHSGAVTGGESKRQQHGIVQRRAELQEIEDEASAIDKELAGLQKKVDSQDEIRKELNGRIESAQKNLHEIQVEENEAKTWLLGLQHERVATEKSRTRLESELERLTQVGGEAVAAVDIKKLEEDRDAVMKQLASKSSDSEQASTRLKEATDRAQTSADRFTEAKRRLKTLKEDDEVRADRAKRLAPDRAAFQAQVQESNRVAAKLQDSVTAASAEIAEGTKNRAEMQAEAAKSAEEVKRARIASTECAEAASKAEIGKARADSRRAAAAERMLDEYGVSEDEAQAMEPEMEVPKDAQRIVSQLRRELRGMGEVNLGAIEAFDRLTERFDELTNQSEDINAGMAEIETGIRELDKLTRDRFESTFAELQVAFADMFKLVFSGGEGKLLLSEAENSLDAGVEIEVTIPGKKRQRLALLSGGERALSALAFLFALLKVKPTPLVVLDEVDAPLDGRNVERYVNMLKSFTDEGIQFILVTHNPRTIQSADVWFGVTMQEPGVSTVVPFKAPGDAEKQADKNGAAQPDSQAELEPAGAV